MVAIVVRQQHDRRSQRAACWPDQQRAGQQPASQGKGSQDELAGKVAVVTGANTGIGKAIALRAAADGANVVIAAKSDRKHPKLPGTIHEAAAEVEAAGGQVVAAPAAMRSRCETTPRIRPSPSTTSLISIGPAWVGLSPKYPTI